MEGRKNRKKQVCLDIDKGGRRKLNRKTEHVKIFTFNKSNCNTSMRTKGTMPTVY